MPHETPKALGHVGNNYGTCVKCGAHFDGIYYSQEKCSETMPHETHNYIERNGTDIKFGEPVLVEVDKLSPLMADRQAHKLDLSTLRLIEVNQELEQLPFFLPMTYSAELLSYHNWRNRIVFKTQITYLDDTQYKTYRLHRISYNEFTWIELQPIDVAEFKSKSGGMRNPYEWEQILGVRVRPEMLKAMGMPSGNGESGQGMRPITLNQFFDAVEV